MECRNERWSEGEKDGMKEKIQREGEKDGVQEGKKGCKKERKINIESKKE